MFFHKVHVFVPAPCHFTGPSSIWAPVFGFAARRRA